MARLSAIALAVGITSSAAAFPIIYDNIDANGGPLFISGDIQASQLDFGFGFDAGVADDFVLPASSDPTGDWQVTGVHWFGRFITGSPRTIDSFNIIFWPDAGNRPAGGNAPGLPPKYSEALAIFEVSADAAPGGGGATSFEYTASLPTAFDAQDGVKYWVEIQAGVNYPPLWGTEMTLFTQGSRPYDGFDLFSTPFWTEFAAARDTAFDLSGEPAPEPASAVLALMGFSLVALRRRMHSCR